MNTEYNQVICSNSRPMSTLQAESMCTLNQEVHSWVAQLIVTREEEIPSKTL